MSELSKLQRQLITIGLILLNINLLLLALFLGAKLWPQARPQIKPQEPASDVRVYRKVPDRPKRKIDKVIIESDNKK